ncbi:ATP-dependent helicase [Dietzia cinnamea]|uniref:ATP-dependent helicase n=1 Tax=Dietzia cinnamea TaxID=321318 RepID=UPI0021A4DDEA|nr:ATP-dependent helicase [Dietzia cinnamea]MCT2120605.1 ATP-dependent helicase [Dietzia cinnamea]MCT2145316.1 ATP-dependent helicase [Dietzia cinnamea]MCT2303359.1 ATP-dependent helicase [Dietzia cinnamea]
MPAALDRFHPATASWFRGAFDAPTAAQEGAWTALAGGSHTLVVAPTGSGKTLSAFLAALDGLLLGDRGGAPDPGPGTRVLYVSPLKALAVDVERNLRAPLAGIAREAASMGVPTPDVTVGIRTGDTPPDERRRQRARPPHILVTTPESLFLLLTSAARETLATVDTVIIDEIHAVAGSKRGAHLALSLERLDELLDTPAQRVGLSATVRPHSEVARFLAGERPTTIVAPGSDKGFELSVRVPVEDMADLSSSAPEVTAPPGTPGQGSIWPHVERQVVDLVTAHRSTIVFVNSRRLAERLTARLNEIYAEDTDPGSLPEPPARPPAQLMVPSEVSRGAPPELAMAHHGSVSKERRAIIEDALKSGRLRAVVATSSLELGIDMGAVDLVVQVESPPSVASGLQRVGRAGHQVGEVSRAVVYPKHRADLVHSAVTVERMLAGAIEELTVIANPLDVLAQQTVAACALEPIDVEEWFSAVRRTAPYAGLPRSAFEATLDMLAGKYPSADFAELKPRLVWDRDAGTLTGRPGAQRLAVTSGGTIPDRGLFGVFMVGEKAARVGELDEEMVYESRVGDVFALGASSWRVEEITHDRVLVSPAPGGTGRLPFWLGDDQGRPAELGRALGGFLREVSSGSEAEVTARLDAAGLDTYAAANLRRYLTDQREATGHVPSDTTLVVERFRDEVGDWRIVLHSPFGARVHWPWAEAVRARLAAAHGFDAVPVVSDDGIILRVPDTGDDGEGGARPGAETFAISAEEAVDLVTRHVGGSALFASRFRECSARALLFPRLDPGRRAPLWQQRQKSAQLLDVARRYPDFPMILEAVRECLQDVYDVPALERLLGEIESRSVRIVEVETPGASPFAQSLLFDYVGAFLYEGDSPLAEKRAAALSIDPGLLGQLLGRVELRELLDVEVLDSIERRLQHLEPERAARDAEAVVDLLRLLGPLTVDEIAARSADPDGVPGWLDELARTWRIVPVEHSGRSWWAGVEDVARLRDGLGVPPPPGVPSAFLGDVGDPLGELIRRYARTHGPFSVEAVAERFGLGVAVVRGVLDRLTSSGTLLAGEFRPGATGPEWCDAEVLRHIRRRSLAALRSQIEPVSHSALGRFLPGWQSLGSGGGGARAGAESGVDGLLAVIEQLDGLALPASALEPLVLAPRVSDYSPAMLDELLAGGEVIWSGRGRAGSRDGWISLHPVDSAGATLPLGRPQPEGPVHLAVVDSLRGGALFFRDIVTTVRSALTAPTDPVPTGPVSTDAAPAVTEAAVRDALWDLVWDGVVTNDTLAPLRAVLAGGGSSGSGTAHRSPRASARPRRARFGRTAMAQLNGAVAAGTRTPPVLAGRWSLVPEAITDATLRAHAWAETLLLRHGVVTRGAVEAEEIPGGFAAVYKVLAQMEDSGRCRRGYFVDGLGAAQFAAGNTIDRLRTFDDTADDAHWPSGTDEPTVRVLAATDPANPYGAALPWPATAPSGGDAAGGGDAAATGGSGHRPGRKAGALVVLVDGICVLFVECGGRTVLIFDDRAGAVPLAAGALVDAVRSGAVGPLTVTTIGGEPVHGSPHAAAFEAAGFGITPKGVRIRR